MTSYRTPTKQLKWRWRVATAAALKTTPPARGNGRREAKLAASLVGSSYTGSLPGGGQIEHLLTSFRARRVRCDEAQPVCRRCTSSGHHCRGYGTVRPDQNTVLDVVVSSSHTNRHNEAPQWGDAVYIEAEPPDWDFMQALRYCKPKVSPCLKRPLLTAAASKTSRTSDQGCQRAS